MQEGYSASFLLDVRRKSCSRSNFAVNMVRELFSLEERKTSNVRGVLGKRQLDPNRLEKIRIATFQNYPCNAGEKEECCWRDACKAVDESCRRHNKEREKNKQKENMVP